MDGNSFGATDGLIEGGGKVPYVEGAVAGCGGKDGGVDGTPLHITHVIVRIAQKAHQRPCSGVSRRPQFGGPIHSGSNDESTGAAQKSFRCACCGSFLISTAGGMEMRCARSCGDRGDHAVMSLRRFLRSVRILVRPCGAAFHPSTHNSTGMQRPYHLLRCAGTVPSRPCQYGVQSAHFIAAENSLLVPSSCSSVQHFHTAEVGVHFHVLNGFAEVGRRPVIDLAIRRGRDELGRRDSPRGPSIRTRSSTAQDPHSHQFAIMHRSPTFSALRIRSGSLHGIPSRPCIPHQDLSAAPPTDNQLGVFRRMELRMQYGASGAKHMFGTLRHG
mmetsp:Transcript_3766/g.7057  ORF Transcript_3766/g.7057 Transcript_3766/m.7057 type:complete len:329 (+) Transcript_3766:363-1349(+)